jgi:hypothetical protein
MSYSGVGTGELCTINYIVQSFRIAQSHRLAIRNGTSLALERDVNSKKANNRMTM